MPFRYFWNFKNKALISATPFEFSDPRFSQLDKHEIIISEKLATIELIEVKRVDGIVPFILTHGDKFPGNVHIFYNSITQLAEQIKSIDVEVNALNVNIYCSESDENMVKLGELKPLFKDDVSDGTSAKSNIYTTKYAEAWDLNDLNATIILITDVHAPHTKIGITNKGVQSLGRLRKKAHRILHFTNHYGRDKRTSPDFFRTKHHFYAKEIKDLYELHLIRTKQLKLNPFIKLSEAADVYCEISEELNRVHIEHIKVDRLVNIDDCNQEYNNMKFIEQAWNASNYNVVLRRVIPSTLPKLKNLKVHQQLELAIEWIHDLEVNKDNLVFSTDYEEAKTNMVEMKGNFELAFKAYHALGYERVIEIGPDKKLLTAALKRKHEIDKGTVVSNLVKLDYEVARYYTNSEVKSKLKRIYRLTEYPKAAVGTDIDDYAVTVRDKKGLTIISFKD